MTANHWALFAVDQPQIDLAQFSRKLGIMAVAMVVLVSYFVYHWWRYGSRYLVGPIEEETRMVLSGEVAIAELQAGAWQANVQKVSTYSAFSLGSLIASVTYMFTQRLTGYDLLTFQLLLFTFGLAVMGYFVSLQFWFLALDAGGQPELRMAYRRYATLLQSFGWFATQAAAAFAVLIVSTVLGLVFSVFGVLSFIWVYDRKAQLAHRYPSPAEANVDGQPR